METFKDKAAALINWFQSHNGAVSSSISLQYNEEYSYYFRAVNDIPASTDEQYGTLVCRCPLKLMLSYLNVLPDLHPTFHDSSKDSVRKSRVQTSIS